MFPFIIIHIILIFLRLDQKEIQTDLFWDELYLSSILRAMSFSPDQLLEIKNALNIINMFPNPQVESEYLDFLKKYIQKGLFLSAVIKLNSLYFHFLF